MCVMNKQLETKSPPQSFLIQQVKKRLIHDLRYVNSHVYMRQDKV